MKTSTRSRRELVAAAIYFEAVKQNAVGLGPKRQRAAIRKALIILDDAAKQYAEAINDEPSSKLMTTDEISRILHLE